MSPKFGAGLLGVCLGLWACAPTLSKPRGDEHLKALAEAERHQHHGRLEQALASYEKAAMSAERRVDRDEALYRESRIRARMGDLAAAVALCDRIAEQKPASRRTLRARLDGARYRLELGQSERAEQDLRSLVREHGDAGEATSALRILLDLRVRPAEHAVGLAYVRELAKGLADNTAREALMREEAELLISLGQSGEATHVLEEQVKRFPYPRGVLWDDSLSRLADLAQNDGDPKAAIAFLQRMLDAHESAIAIGSYTRPKLPEAALRIARIYRDDLKDPDAAVKAYRSVQSEFPSSRVVDDALAEEGELWLSRGDRTQGCALLQRVLTEHEVGAAHRRAQARVAQDCAP